MKGQVEIISEGDAPSAVVDKIAQTLQAAAGVEDAKISKKITIEIDAEGRVKFELSGIEQESVPIWLKRAAISAEEMLLNGVR